jgi:hypothetical protein
MTDSALAEQLAQIVIRGVAGGKEVEIEPLGVFYPDPDRGFRFVARPQLRVFLAYVTEDRPSVELLYDELENAGYAPWMDVRKLLPGQNWPRAIEGAIENSDFFIACFSDNSVNKRGGFQSEIRYALDCARRMPLDRIFIVPVRLTPCRVPRAIQREFQYADLFPDWKKGIRRVLAMMRRERA